MRSKNGPLYARAIFFNSGTCVEFRPGLWFRANPDYSRIRSKCGLILRSLASFSILLQAAGQFAARIQFRIRACGYAAGEPVRLRWAENQATGHHPGTPLRRVRGWPEDV